MNQLHYYLIFSPMNCRFCSTLFVLLLILLVPAWAFANPPEPPGPESDLPLYMLLPAAFFLEVVIYLSVLNIFCFRTIKLAAVIVLINAVSWPLFKQFVDHTYFSYDFSSVEAVALGELGVVLLETVMLLFASRLSFLQDKNFSCPGWTRILFAVIAANTASLIFGIAAFEFF